MVGHLTHANLSTEYIKIDKVTHDNISNLMLLISDGGQNNEVTRVPNLLTSSP